MRMPLVSDPRKIAEIIARGEAMGYGYKTPLLRAAMAGKVFVAELGPEAVPPLGQMKKARKPGVIVIGDDADDTRLGPDGWRSAQRLRRWCEAAIVHGAGGAPQHYEAAVAGALQEERFLFIETASAHAEAWFDFLVAERPLLPILVIVPTDGDHPAQWETVH